MSLQTICIIGAGLWQTPYLLRARELGYRVIACDWSAEASGRKHADIFEAIDVKDKQGVLDFARRHSAHAVLTAADIGVPTAAFVAAQLQLPYHTEKLAFQATNKVAMRSKASDVGIAIPRYKVLRRGDDILMSAAEIGFPVICKPSDNCSSRGVTVVSNEKDLKDACALAWENSLDGNILLEELMYGTEGSIEAICSNGKITVLGICSKIKSELPYRYDLRLNYPGNFREHEFIAIENLLSQVVTGFEIIDGIVHLEFIVEDSRPRLIEFALRGCGSNVITHLIPALTGFDPVAYLIKQSFGLQGSIHLTRGKHAVLSFLLLPEGTIKTIKGIAKILDRAAIVDFLLEKKPGDVIYAPRDGRSRPGYMIAVTDSLDSINYEIAYVHDTLDIEYEPA